jgi:hypothetical protein
MVVGTHTPVQAALRSAETSLGPLVYSDTRMRGGADSVLEPMHPRTGTKARLTVGCRRRPSQWPDQFNLGVLNPGRKLPPSGIGHNNDEAEDDQRD